MIQAAAVAPSPTPQASSNNSKGHAWICAAAPGRQFGADDEQWRGIQKKYNGRYDVNARYYGSHQDSKLTGSTSAVVWTMKRGGRENSELTIDFHTVRLTNRNQTEKVGDVQVHLSRPKKPEAPKPPSIFGQAQAPAAQGLF